MPQIPPVDATMKYIQFLHKWVGGWSSSQLLRSFSESHQSRVIQTSFHHLEYIHSQTFDKKIWIDFLSRVGWGGKCPPVQATHSLTLRGRTVRSLYPQKVSQVIVSHLSIYIQFLRINLIFPPLSSKHGSAAYVLGDPFYRVCFF